MNFSRTRNMVDKIAMVVGKARSLALSMGHCWPAAMDVTQTIDRR